MWRIQGFVGRVLHRCHGSNPLRLPQNQGQSQGLGEVEVINSSTVLAAPRHSSDDSSQKEGDGERRRKRRTFQIDYAELPRYTALDAVGWGTAAVLFMQICRRIHSQFSSSTEPSPIPEALTAPSVLHKCGYRILLEILSRRDVLPRGQSVYCLQEVPERQRQHQAESSSSNSNSSSSSGGSGDAGPHSASEQDYLTVDCAISDQQSALLNQESPSLEESFLSAPCPLQNDTNQDNKERRDANDKGVSDERLAGAALNLRQVGESSVPVILNIIGLESAKSENYEEAFTCFLAAAQQGYSKAQFNTGVCYEKGRGVSKDIDKAVYYYGQAAAGGHRQAQYRYAKLLMTSRGHQSLEEVNTAISFLEQAAAAGLTKAQVCLASVYAQEPVRDGNKSIQYLKMAAESGDDTALLFLGQCFERGFGVQLNPRAATDYYKRAARAGNKQAKSLLTRPNDTFSKEDAALRSIRSSPCFSAADHRLQQLSSLASHVPPSSSRLAALPLLPHSWSTGSLCPSPALSSMQLHLYPQSTRGGACQWTEFPDITDRSIVAASLLRAPSVLRPRR